MATARALRLLASSSTPSAAHRTLQAVVPRRRLLSSTTTTTTTTTEAGGAGDPALHSGDAPSEEYTDRPPRFSAATTGTGGKGKPPSEPSKERVPPFGPSGKLGSQELADPSSGASLTPRRSSGSGESAARKVREEDREYYRTHKPSPLAELEFADTRKPLTQATDSDRLSDVKGNTVEDTADESLARAEAMFRDAASRGNPEWPHSRALAHMLRVQARRNQQQDNNGGARRSS